jgi:uncharacterized protein HemX
MNAKGPPARRDGGAAPQDLHQAQTRKIDSMSELAADLMLREHDGISGVQPTVAPRPSSPPPLSSRPAFPSQPVPERRSAGSVVIAVALLLALGLGFALAAFLLAR